MNATAKLAPQDNDASYKAFWLARAIPDHGVYPGLEDRWNQPPDERMAILFPKIGVERLTEKIVRGISFVEGQDS